MPPFQSITISIKPFTAMELEAMELSRFKLDMQRSKSKAVEKSPPRISKVAKIISPIPYIKAISNQAIRPILGRLGLDLAKKSINWE